MVTVIVAARLLVDADTGIQIGSRTERGHVVAVEVRRARGEVGGGVVGEGGDAAEGMHMDLT